jgi:hypothetical protein
MRLRTRAIGQADTARIAKVVGLSIVGKRLIWKFYKIGLALPVTVAAVGLQASGCRVPPSEFCLLDSPP